MATKKVSTKKLPPIAEFFISSAARTMLDYLKYDPTFSSAAVRILKQVRDRLNDLWPPTEE